MNADITMNIWTLVAGVITLLLTGAGVGLAGAVALVRTVRNDKAMLAAIEGLANSRPDDQRLLANTFAKGLKEVGELVDEATDGIPADSKADAQTVRIPKRED